MQRIVILSDILSENVVRYNFDIFSSFLIENFHGGRKYILDMNVSACFESHGNCSYMIPVLKKAVLPKVKCHWMNGFNDQGTSFFCS